MTAPEPIAWNTARTVASRVNGREPFSSSYLLASCERDLLDASERAAALVERETGLYSAAGDVRAKVITRDEWVTVNLRSFERLAAPLLQRITEKSEGSPSVIGRNVAGAQLGAVLGWASTRVLGQYDFELPDDTTTHHDVVYYVAPNVLALEKRYAFPPKEFRLWLAVHELTHRAQFTGVPWLPQYFQSLVNDLLTSVEEPQALGDSLRRAASEIRHGDSTSAKDGGVMAMFASPRQQEVLGRVAGLMALLEGHAEVTMQRAATEAIPNADRFHRVLHERRNKAGIGKLIQKLLGMDAKLRQYAEGKRFIETIEKSAGVGVLRQVWLSADHLPTSEEIRAPQAWLDRVATIDLARPVVD